jgi:hypothetical protein
VEQFAAAGWRDRTNDFEAVLKSHPLSFLQRYDWDWFLVCKEPQPSNMPPAPFDITSYPKEAWSKAGSAIDRRHLFWMYEVLAASGFQHALEIGCFNGASSTIFVEAINRGLLQRATFCDVAIKPSLREVLQRCQYPDRIEIVEGPSVEPLKQRKDFDCVLVDGDHSTANVREEVDLLLGYRPRLVMTHDTNAFVCGYTDCTGPLLLKWRFQTTAPYQCLEDNVPRPGEDTGRGLFLATTSPEVFEHARTALATWGAPVDR